MSLWYFTFVREIVRLKLSIFYFLRIDFLCFLWWYFLHNSRLDVFSLFIFFTHLHTLFTCQFSVTRSVLHCLSPTLPVEAIWWWHVLMTKYSILFLIPFSIFDCWARSPDCHCQSFQRGTRSMNLHQLTKQPSGSRSVGLFAFSLSV